MMTRDEAVENARSFLRTPYILGAHVKGAGVDCATLLACCLQEWGFATKEDFSDIGIYHGDWFCHANSERYMFRLIRHAQKTVETVCMGVVDAKPGSLVLFRVAGSRLFNHGGIVTQWPFMIHAVDPRVREDNATTYYMTGHMHMAVFDPWERKC